MFTAVWHCTTATRGYCKHPVLQPPKRLRLLNESGRYNFFTLGYPDFAAVKWKRLLNGSGCNSVFYGNFNRIIINKLNIFSKNFKRF